MSDQNSRPNNTISPDTLQNELSIKRATYYADLKHLGIIADKDEEGKPYLTFEQAEQVRQLRSYVNNYGTRKGFVYEKVDDESNIRSSIIKTEESIIETSNSSATSTIVHPEEDIYVTEQETNPTNKVNLDSIINNAQELAARNLVMPELLAVELANNMSYEDLTPELQAKINIARDAANPKKYQPKTIALDLLKQLRSRRAS